MSFALWINGDVARAQGTYESRPMGTAVISVTDLFKRRDFRAAVRAPGPLDPGYLGLFASIGALNAQLRACPGAPTRSGRQLAQKKSRGMTR